MLNDTESFNLGKYLKSLRGKESIRSAAKRIGISNTYLATIENGFDKRSGNLVKPTPETLKLIAKAYNVEYQKLMEICGYLEDSTCTSKLDLDISQHLLSLIRLLKNTDKTYFEGKLINELTKEYLVDSIKYLIQQTRRIN